MTLTYSLFVCFFIPFPPSFLPSFIHSLFCFLSFCLFLSLYSLCILFIFSIPFLFHLLFYSLQFLPFPLFYSLYPFTYSLLVFILLSSSLFIFLFPSPPFSYPFITLFSSISSIPSSPFTFKIPPSLFPFLIHLHPLSTLF